MKHMKNLNDQISVNSASNGNSFLKTYRSKRSDLYIVNSDNIQESEFNKENEAKDIQIADLKSSCGQA